MAVAKGKTRITITLDGPLYDMIKDRAAIESRTIAGQIRHELKKVMIHINEAQPKRNGNKQI